MSWRKQDHLLLQLCHDGDQVSSVYLNHTCTEEIGAVPTSTDNVHEKLDWIITELDGIHIEFCQQCDLENKCWERLLPLLHSGLVPGPPFEIKGPNMPHPPPFHMTGWK